MNSKIVRILLPSLMISLFLMACGLMGLLSPNKTPGALTNPSSQGNPPSAPGNPTNAPLDTSSSPSGGGGVSDKTDFPLPPNTKILSNTPDLVTAQVKATSDDVVAYYRQVLPKQGLTEDSTFTSIVKPTFNLEFKGSKNGKMLIVQGTELGDGNVAFTIRYE